MLEHNLSYFIARILLGVFVALSLIALATTSSYAASHDTPAYIRVIHASPDIGTADVFLDGNELLNNFAFGTVTDYATVPPGPHKVQVSLIGKGIGAAMITQTLAVSAGTAYTVAALGTQATGFSLRVFIDNNQLASGAAKVRFYHLSPGTGTVNVSTNNTMLVQGLGYEQASDYVDLSTGSYTFQASATQPNVTLPVSTILKANTVTSVFAVGVVQGTPAIRFVSSQVNGIPGLPQTGSDPNAVAAPQHTNTSPFSYPYWATLFLLIVVGAGMSFWRAAHYRRR